MLYADGLDELALKARLRRRPARRDEIPDRRDGRCNQAASATRRLRSFSARSPPRGGYDFDAMTFPISGVPAFPAAPHSADLASIQAAVARQESEFLWQASSGAGYQGPDASFCRRRRLRPRRAGVAFDYARLLVDPAFNTQRFGAVFLGQVLEDEGGSYASALAAYGPAAAGWCSGSRRTVIREPAALILSTGSSAFPSTKRATTLSG